MKTIVTALFAMIWLCAAAIGQNQSNVRIEMVVTAYSNVWLTDEDGDTPAFIRLANLQTSGDFILDDYYLSDDAGNRQKWQFPKGTRIPQNGELILFASGKDLRPENGEGDLHTNFLYPCSVPNLILSEPIEGQQIDQYRDTKDQCVDCPGTPVINGNTLSRFLIPLNDRNEDDWFTESFDANKEGWPRGGPCFGYEVIGQTEESCLVLHSTMDAADIDLPKFTLLDVSGSAVTHNGFYEAMSSGEIVSGQIQAAIEVPSQEIQSYPIYSNHPELEPGTGEFSASIWVAPTGSGKLEAIASKAGDFSSFLGWWIMLDEELLKVRVGGGIPGANPFVTEVVGERPKVEEWTHVFFRVDRKDHRLALFINGNLVDEKSIPAGVDLSYNDGDLLLGTAQTSSGQTADYRGRLDDFALWSCALSDEEIATIYEKGINGETFNDPQPPGGGGGLANTEIYRDCYDVDVEPAMYGINPSLWAIYPFSVNDPETVLSMRLFLKYDDGYVVFLNGQEVARSNYSGASPPAYDATADEDRADEDALIPEFINLSAFRHLLKAGTNNRLAIAGLNADKGDSRFLLCPQLCIETGENPTRDCKVTTVGQEFWVAFPGNAPTDPSNPLELSICVRGSASDPVTVVGVVTADGLHQEVKPIGAGGVVRFVIPNEYTLDEGETPEKSGVYVLASQPISVYAQTRIDYSTDSYTVLPLGVLGDDYWVLGYENVWEDDAGEILNGTQFAVCAAFDGTVVTIEPTAGTASNPSGGTVTVNLDRGETYMMRSLDEGGDFSGTRVRSNRPVAVYGGHRCANIPDENVFFCDTVVEQLLPTKHWGIDHTTVPLASGNSAPVVPRPAGDVVRVIASRDGTQLRRNGVIVADLDAGEVYETVEKFPANWTAKLPIMVAQYSQSSDADGVVAADPFMALVQPRYSWLPRYSICSPVTDGFNANYVNIVVQEGFLGSGSLSPIRINGAALLRNRFTTIPGTGLAYAREQVPVGTNSVDSSGFQSSFPFGLLIYGFSTYDSYGHPGGMCFFDNEPPQIYDCNEEMVVYAEESGEPGVPASWVVPSFSNIVSYFDPGVGTIGAQFTQSIAAGTNLIPGKYYLTIRVQDTCQRTTDCVIQITVMPPWQEVNFPNAYPDPNLEEDVWGWDADPDKDGKTNEEEFRFGCDPNDPSDGDNAATSGFLPSPNGSGGTLTLTFSRRAYAPGLSYVPEGSEDTLGWESGDEVMRLIQETTMPGGEYVRMTFEAVKSGDSPSGRYFVRARSGTDDEGSGASGR